MELTERFKRDLERRIGEELSFTASDPIGLGDIRLFALAVDDENPHYLDPYFAHTTPYECVVAPPTMITDTACYHDGRTDADGGALNRVRLGGATEIRAENDYRFHRLLRAGDVLSVRSQVTNVFEKSGRTGPLVFVVTEFAYENQDGKLLATNTETMIFRISTHVE